MESEKTFHQRAWFRRTVIVAILVVICAGITIPVYFVYMTEGQKFQSFVERVPSGVADYILVEATISSVNLDDRIFKAHMEFIPQGRLAGPHGVLTVPVNLNLYTETVAFPANENMRTIEKSFSYYQGNVVGYPFDQYKGYFEMYAHFSQNLSLLVPLGLKLDASLHTFKVTPTLRQFSFDTEKIGIDLLTRRSNTTIGFSIWVQIIMWALALSLAYVTVQAIVKRRPVDAHFCSLGIAMLFALPALREAQPDIPKTGCAADVLGYYWNMAIIAGSSIMVMLTFGLRWKKGDPEHHHHHGETMPSRPRQEMDYTERPMTHAYPYIPPEGQRYAPSFASSSYIPREEYEKRISSQRSLV
ncbi:uncharacterized protein VTP21DRAFT_8808 [Calcarisporiella thermophila]|uniref:uncharacterized protein n=1 Tax=Calcarisporiella thermophila TaxID=911321 RepID=UPI0037440745